SPARRRRSISKPRRLGSTGAKAISIIYLGVAVLWLSQAWSLECSSRHTMLVETKWADRRGSADAFTAAVVAKSEHTTVSPGAWDLTISARTKRSSFPPQPRARTT